MLREDLQKVLDEYLIAKTKNGTTSSPIANYITKDIRNHINDILDSDKYLCGSSAGKGNMAEIPWIDFGIKLDDDAKFKNVNVAYFFKADMSGVYLTLRAFYFGELENKYQQELPNFLKSQSIHIKELIEKTDFKTDDLNKDEIDLATNSATAKRHNSGIIYSKYYESGDLPSEETLISDLKRFLELDEFVINNYVDEMFLTVDEWIEALEDEKLISSKLLNILEIIYNSNDHTACYKDISKVRESLGFPDEKDYSFDIGINSKKIKDYFSKTSLFNKERKEEQWSRIFYGKYMKNPEMKSEKAFYFTLREEVIEALEKYDKTKRTDRIELTMNYHTKRPVNYWLISAGYGAGWWDEFYKNNVVAIGFGNTGDLKQFKNKEEIQKKLQEIYNDGSTHSNDALACWQFVHEMQIGDVIIVKNGMSEIIGRGIIESDYEYNENIYEGKFRKVNWTHRGNWKFDEKLPQKTLTNITYNPKLDKIKRLFEPKKYDSFYDYLLDKGYYFDKETVENYLLSLKVKPFVILTGNSGTGKTKLSQLFAQYLNQKDNYKIIPVGANWTENRHILGYFNIIKNEPQYTPAYHLIEKSQSESYPHFLILDEMNLSHVERYFADFLSAIESNESIPLHGKEELEIPNNLFIIGTVNVDETTYMFSPKVLDRANTIEFETYNAKNYMKNKFNLQKPKGNVKYLEDILDNDNVSDMNINELKEFLANDELWDILSDEIFKFQEILKGASFDFGFRVINEIVRFMAVAYKYEREPENWNNWQRYFDAQIKQKMLPKLHGSQKVIGETLDELLNACEDYPTSKAKLEEMISVLSKQRYVSFIN